MDKDKRSALPGKGDMQLDAGEFDLTMFDARHGFVPSCCDCLWKKPVAIATSCSRRHDGGMLDHVSITVADFATAETFYDAIMAAIGVPKVGRDEGWLGYGERCDGDHPERSYVSVRPGPRPETSHGRHWCFKAPSRVAVDDFWRAGLANGGTDDGPPGFRKEYHPTYYAAFLIDPGGNRVEAVFHGRNG
jgi:catechol 2,3-dioxygenase-like lactoylglutathione lyase family enzyme